MLSPKKTSQFIPFVVPDFKRRVGPEDSQTILQNLVCMRKIRWWAPVYATNVPIGLECRDSYPTPLLQNKTQNKKRFGFCTDVSISFKNQFPSHYFRIISIKSAHFSSHELEMTHTFQPNASTKTKIELNSPKVPTEKYLCCFSYIHRDNSDQECRIASVSSKIIEF